MCLHWGLYTTQNAREKIAMLVGQLNKFEIWSETTWHTQIQDAQTLVHEQTLTNHRLEDFAL